MKLIAILLMLLGVFLILGLGLVYVFGFAMSFDAPGSDTDAKAWLFRLLMFSPILIFGVLLIFALRAYVSGNYRRSVRLGAVFAIAAFGIPLFFNYTSSRGLKAYYEYEAQQAEYVRLYPKHKFLRPFDGGADTIIVFPNRIVAYRLTGRDIPYSGPLGDLNESRDTIIYKYSQHNMIPIEELDQFADEHGQKITDVFKIK